MFDRLLVSLALVRILLSETDWKFPQQPLFPLGESSNRIEPKQNRIAANDRPPPSILLFAGFVGVACGVRGSRVSHEH